MIKNAEDFYERTGWWAVVRRSILPMDSHFRSTNRRCSEDELLPFLIGKRSWRTFMGRGNNSRRVLRGIHSLG